MKTFTTEADSIRVCAAPPLSRYSPVCRSSHASAIVVPLLHEPGRPPLTFRVSMGVRHNENDWKRSLNTVLRKRKADIEAVLREYEVPLLAEEDTKPLDAADE